MRHTSHQSHLPVIVPDWPATTYLYRGSGCCHVCPLVTQSYQIIRYATSKNDDDHQHGKRLSWGSFLIPSGFFHYPIPIIQSWKSGFVTDLDSCVIALIYIDQQKLEIRDNIVALSIQIEMYSNDRSSVHWVWKLTKGWNGFYIYF